VRSVLVEDNPDRVTRQSAAAVQEQARATTDPDVGKARQRRPKLKAPPGPLRPPDPKAIYTMLAVEGGTGKPKRKRSPGGQGGTRPGHASRKRTPD
jgi:hypothetical protein